MGSLDGAPVVELIDAFDPDDFVGPPPGTTLPQSGARPVHNRTTTNPIGATRLQSPYPPGRRPQYEPPRPTGCTNTVSSSSSSPMNTEAISYTPAPPSELANAQRGKTRGRRGTRRFPDIDNPVCQPTSSLHNSDIPLAPPRIRLPPTSQPSTSAFTAYLQQAPLAHTTQPSILRQPPGQRPTLNSIVTGLQANSRNPSISTSRFGAASFTTYQNDTNNPSSWNQSYLNVLQQNQAKTRLPLPAHSQQSTPYIPPGLAQPTGSLITPQSSSRVQSVRPRAPAPVAGSSFGDLVSRAMPVRSAYEDFMRHVQMAIPGVDVNELIRQISDNPTNPIQLQVPEGLNTASIQRELQQSLEQTMLMAFQSPTPVSINHNMTPSSFHPQQMLTNNQAIIPQLKPLPPSEDEMAKQDIDADANQDEEYHEVETYADYSPAKLSIGKPHPDPIVETSSLSTVQPPDINYELCLPSKVVDGGLLSSLQLESVIYACQQHNSFLPDKVTRRGFLIGDGAGVGKGRTIAGIIYENHLCGRKKSIWLSVSGDLKLDAERDLKDIGANKIPVFHLGKFQYGRRINVEHGVVFTTYSGLVSKSQSIRGSLGTRIGQLIAWAGPNFDGVIVFDECHKAKNISMSKTKKTHSKAAEFALEIQNKLPGARVVYASATGASETKHLGYMTRLGIWGKGTPYETFSEFCSAIEKRGVGAMELVAVDLKMRGSYIARQLSFKTTSFEIRIACLDKKFTELYDQCVDMWARALTIFEEAAALFSGDRKRSRTIWTSFWAAHQKFFKYLCIGAKVPLVTKIAQDALAQEKCVVIGLQSTGEAKTIEALDDGDINEFISTARATFESLVENHFPAPKTKSPSPSIAKSSSSSSTSPIDENWHSHTSFKFLADDKNGVAKALLEEEKAASELNRSGKSKKDANSSTTCRRNLRNQKVLDELAEEKRAELKAKSSRALRAKRRASARATRKSRIKKMEDSSDTEISNPLSLSSEERRSGTSASKTDEDDSDDSYASNDYSNEDEDESETSDSTGTLIDSDEEYDGPTSAKRRKGGRKATSSSSKKRNALESDSDSDIQITAVKPKRNYEVIILSSDEDSQLPLDKSDPMVKHADRLTRMKRELLNMLDSVAPNLPNNTLDDLIDRLGGPSQVAEMTGRKGRVVKDEHGKISYRNRNESDALENLNIVEKERFMNGDKYIAIISEAASSGISLQADRRIKNQRRRVHITIELPWSADRAIQQFGRTHRSNQTSGPEYVFVISELAGEKRFASIVAKRLESLGALTHGDRRATTDARDLSQFNIAGRYCKSALDLLCRYLELGTPFANIKPDYDGNFLVDAQNAFVGAGLASKSQYSFSVEQQASQVNHFLNRLLGMKVGIQNALFKLFTDYMDRLISRKKVAGLYDAGILELNSESGKTRCDVPEEYSLKTQGGIVKCTLHNVQVERGITWEEALNILNTSAQDSRAGFHISTNSLTKASMVYLLVREPDTVDLFRAYKPNTGRAAKANLYAILAASSKKGTLEAAEKIWRYVYNATDSKCVHLCFFNSCKRIEGKLKCDVGLRHRNFCLLSGGILTAWPYLETKVPEATSKLQIVRLKLDSSNRVIGPIIPQDHVDHVRRILREGENGIQFKRTSKVHIDLPSRNYE